MKTIGSFKLHKRGMEGISITTEMFTKNPTEEEGKIYHDQVNTFRKAQVPQSIMDAIGKLKFFFLDMCGYWIEVYGQYLDEETYTLIPPGAEAKQSRRFLQTLWDAVDVTQVRVDDRSFTIMGCIEVIDGKVLNLNPPAVTADDGFEGYENCKEMIGKVMSLIAAYFSTIAISDTGDYRRYLLENADENGKQEIAAFDDDMILNRVMDKLHKSGAIIMMDGNAEAEETVDAVAEDVTNDPEPEITPDPEVEDGNTGTPPNEDRGAELPEEDWPEEPGSGEDMTYTPPVEKADIGQGTMVASEVEPGDLSGHEEGIDDLPEEDFE